MDCGPLFKETSSSWRVKRTQKSRLGNPRRLGNWRSEKEPCGYLTRWPETSFVSSNMLTDFLPFNTGLSLSSALIWVRTFLS